MVQNVVKKKEVFAEGLNWYKLLWCFAIASLIGTWYEELITILRDGVWQSRRGLIYGPFNPLYGAGFIITIMIFHRFKDPIKIFVLGGLFGATFEYFLGYFQEVIFGSKSWSYEGQFLNIQGRTSPIYALVWGIFAVAFVKVVYPYVSKMIESIPKNQGVIISRILLVFFVLNITLTVGVLLRYNHKMQGIKAITPLGEFYDEHFGEEVISDLFPDMVFIE